MPRSQLGGPIVSQPFCQAAGNACTSVPIHFAQPIKWTLPVTSSRVITTYTHVEKRSWKGCESYQPEIQSVFFATRKKKKKRAGVMDVNKRREAAESGGSAGAALTWTIRLHKSPREGMRSRGRGSRRWRRTRRPVCVGSRVPQLADCATERLKHFVNPVRWCHQEKRVS